MPISDLCSRKPITVHPTQSLVEAAKLMKASHVGTLVVTAKDGHDRALGVITDRDIIMKCVAEGKSPESSTVQEIMSSQVISANKSVGVYEAIDLMLKKGIRRLVIVDDSEKMCGVVSTDDLVQMLGQEMTSIGRLYETQNRAEAPSLPRPH